MTTCFSYCLLSCTWSSSLYISWEMGVEGLALGQEYLQPVRKDLGSSSSHEFTSLSITKIDVLAEHGGAHF